MRKGDCEARHVKHNITYYKIQIHLCYFCIKLSLNTISYIYNDIQYADDHSGL